MSQRTYPDGNNIPFSLPSSYKLATGEEKCSNCRYYNKQYCKYWDASVRPEYWCRVWKA